MKHLRQVTLLLLAGASSVQFSSVAAPAAAGSGEAGSTTAATLERATQALVDALAQASGPYGSTTPMRRSPTSPRTTR